MKKKARFHKCENCSTSYMSRSTYKTHQRGCVQGVYHECEICDFQTGSIHILDSHMDTHVVGKQWFCLECKDDEGNRTFQSVGSLRAHTHSVHKVQLRKLSYREDPVTTIRLKLVRST